MDRGITDGIPWTKMSHQGRRLIVPHGAGQFAVVFDLEELHAKRPAHIVIRVHTLEPVPPHPPHSWSGAYSSLGPALREVVEREEAWLSLAIEMLGSAGPDTYQGQPATLFEQRAYENQRDPRFRRRLT